MEFPEPVIQLAIEPKTKDMQEKMALALAKLMQRRPILSEFQQTKKLAKLSLPVWANFTLKSSLTDFLREFKVEATVGEPQVSYSEAIKKAVQAEGKFVRQSGGKGQYGHCIIEMEPLPARLRL